MSDHSPRYPGAQPFSDNALARRLFFGREGEAVALTHKILANRLVLLFGRSGLGKTSLINAGVAERLRDEGHVPLVVRFNDPNVEPLQCIYPRIESECRRQGVEYVKGLAPSLWHFFKTAEFWRADRLLTPVLVLDQFEEIFTLQSEGGRADFLDQLSFLVRGVCPPDAGGREGDAAATALSGAPPVVGVLISMREDFLARLDEMADRIPQIFGERFRLVPMNRNSAEAALEQPAAVEDDELATRPFRIEGAAKEAILDFLSRRAAGSMNRAENNVEPFQLQLICQHLEAAAQRKQGRGPAPEQVTVTLSDIGGPAGLRLILQQFYRRQLGAVPGFLQRSHVRKLCSEGLITPNGRRVRMEQSEIGRIYRIKPATLQILVENRLLRAEQDPETTYYELSHDSLIGPVLRSRRFFFILRAVWAVLITLLLVFLGAWILTPALETESLFELAGAALVLSVPALLFLRGALRSFRLAGELIRRSMSG